MNQNRMKVISCFLFLVMFSINSYAGLFGKKDWYWTESMTSYSQKNKPLAEAGQIKFSDYYKGAVSLLESFDIDEKKLFEIHVRKFEVNSYNNMIVSAIKFENNEMTRVEFDELRNKTNSEQLKELERLSKIEKECKWEATSRGGNSSSFDSDMTSNNPNKSMAAAIVGGIEAGSRQSNLMRLCVDAKL